MEVAESYECPRCKSHNMNIERRPNGKVECADCGFVMCTGAPHAVGGIGNKVAKYTVRYAGIYGKGRRNIVEFKFDYERDAREMARLIILGGHECKIYLTMEL